VSDGTTNSSAVNTGIQVFGGSLQAAAMAVGDGARVQHVNTTTAAAARTSPDIVTDLPTARQLLAALAERIEAERGTIPAPDEALRMVTELQTALEQPEATVEDPPGLFARLLDAVGPTTDLATMVTAVSAALAALGLVS
jgi:hypothetical protein